jgi:predicted XRE-type DNA-binding protein
MKKNNNYTISSGNVFADIGSVNPEEALIKAQLACQINDLIKQKRLTQKAAAQLLGVDQPKISALSKGSLSGFSLERLFRFLSMLGQVIIIKVTAQKRKSEKTGVKVLLPKLSKVSPGSKSSRHPACVCTPRNRR